MIENMNSVYDDMHNIIIENEKTSLYEMYYDVELKDRSKGVSKREWERLIGRLTVEQRERLNRIATFEEVAGSDGIITFPEFQSLVQKTLESYEKEIIRKESASMFGQ